MSKKYLTNILIFINKAIYPLITICYLVLTNPAGSEQFYNIDLPNGHKIKAELAVDKSKGLQERKQLCPQCGMIFVFEKEGIYSFWMKDTLISLAMIWMDSNGRITNIVSNAQPCRNVKNPYSECPVYSTDKPSKYVLEINPSDAKNLMPGTLVNITIPQTSE